jgi:hypothetical protein
MSPDLPDDGKATHEPAQRLAETISGLSIPVDARAADEVERLAGRTAARRSAASALLGSPRPTDDEPAWQDVERERLDSAPRLIDDN